MPADSKRARRANQCEWNFRWRASRCKEDGEQRDGCRFYCDYHWQIVQELRAWLPFHFEELRSGLTSMKITIETPAQKDRGKR